MDTTGTVPSRLLQGALECVEDAIVVVDRTGVVRHLNRAAEALTGWQSGEACGLHARDVCRFVDSRTGAAVEGPLALALDHATRQPVAQDAALLSRDGNAVSLTGYAVPTRTPSGHLCGATLLMRAVARHTGALALDDIRRDLHRRIVDTLDAGVWIVDHEMRTVYANERMSSMLGLMPGGLIGQPIASFFADEDRTRVRNAVAPGQPAVGSDFVSRLVRADGSLCPARAAIFPIADAQGAPLGAYAIVTDVSELRGVERALAQSEERARALFEYSPVAIWEEDFSAVARRFAELRRQGVTDFRQFLSDHPEEVRNLASLIRIVDINTRTLDVFRVRSKDDIPLNLAVYFQGHAWVVFADELTALAEGRTRFECEIPVRDLDDGVRSLHLSLTVVPGYEETLARVLVTFVDLSARQAAEDAVRVSEERIRGLFHNMREAFARIQILREGGQAVDYRFMEVNPAFERITGLRRATGRTLRDIAGYPDPARVPLLEMYTRIIDTGVPEQDEVFIEGIDRWCAVSAYRYSADEVACMFDDITERKRAEDVLRISKTRLSSAQAVGHIGSFEEDIQTGVLWWSDEMYELFGVPAGSEDVNWDYVIGRIYPEDAAALGEHRAQAMERGLCGDMEYRIVCADGSIRCHYLHAVVERDPDGAPRRLTGTVQDITERKALEAQLQQASKMEAVGRLAGGVAHDFNNMLQVILGHCEMVLPMVEAQGPVADSLHEIVHAAERSAALTRQLLAFARKQTISPMPLDLNDLVANLQRMLRRLIGEHIDLIWVPDIDVWTVNIDPSQVDQVLTNLVVNARDAIGPTGTVTVETANVTVVLDDPGDHAGVTPGQYVVLTVSDTGEGMDSDTARHAFEPFFTTKAAGSGTGLGLALVYGIARQNGGTATISSRPGEGTSVRVYLPRWHGGTASEAEVERPCSRGVGSEVILVAEDDEQLLRLVTAILEQRGYTVHTARNPMEAITLAGRHASSIRLLLTDIIMPMMNGRELFERVAALCPGVRCVYMSGYTASVLRHSGIAASDMRFLQKPFASETLASAVREALDSPAPRAGAPAL